MKLVIPSVPHLVHIETTYECNQQCRFCYNPNRHKKFSQDIVDKIIRAVFNSWIPHVYLIGGEPSLLGCNKLNEYIELLTQRSSVTIVTNGQIYLDGLSDKLACLGVPIHGTEKTHDFLANKKGSFRSALRSAEAYAKKGFNVRCIPVLTRENFDQMYEVISIARDIGMESVFVDRYEDGGMGSHSSEELKPSLEQFRIALGQMIAARNDFGIPIGWGTAIPFCLDERLVSENMSADCGAGITFCAVNPKGEVRACNQSERVYGNILQNSLGEIWHTPELSEFRDLKWIEKPCNDCSALYECMCGCKVDANCSDTFCVDYAVRNKDRLCDPSLVTAKENSKILIPSEFRSFQLNKYTRLNMHHSEKYLVTRYQTILLNELALSMLLQIKSGASTEEALIHLNYDCADEYEVRKFISILKSVSAIDEIRR